MVPHGRDLVAHVRDEEVAQSEGHKGRVQPWERCRVQHGVRRELHHWAQVDAPLTVVVAEQLGCRGAPLGDVGSARRLAGSHRVGLVATAQLLSQCTTTSCLVLGV